MESITKVGRTVTGGICKAAGFFVNGVTRILALVPGVSGLVGGQRKDGETDVEHVEPQKQQQEQQQQQQQQKPELKEAQEATSCSRTLADGNAPEKIDDAPLTTPPVVPAEAPVSAPSPAPAITEDVTSVTQAIDEIEITDKAVAAAVNEAIKNTCVSNEIIADSVHSNNINE